MTKIKLQLFGLGKVWDERIVEANDPDEIQGAIDSMNSSLPKDAACAWIVNPMIKKYLDRYGRCKSYQIPSERCIG
jgi:cellulase/cellobiase CelA1